MTDEKRPPNSTGRKFYAAENGTVSQPSPMDKLPEGPISAVTFSEALGSRSIDSFRDFRLEALKQKKLYEEEIIKLTSEHDAIVKSILSKLEDDRKEFSRREALMEQRMSDQTRRIEKQDRDIDMRRDEMLALQHSNEMRRKELDARLSDFEAERIRYTEESQNRLKTISTEYVSSIVLELNTDERKNYKISFWWSIAGGGALAFGFIIMSIVSLASIFQSNSDMSWPLLSFYAFKGAILLGIVGFLARYAFLQSGNYMSESLRTADRIHAIKFGQFFVKTYGAAADWTQVKEAFSNWNGEERGSWSKDIELQGLDLKLGDMLDKIAVLVKPKD